MVTIRAILKLYIGENKRATAFATGYRPLFLFDGTMKTSGRIRLLNQESFAPGTESIVEISFSNTTYLGQSFRVGKTFKFYESDEPLGEGAIIAIL